MTNFSTLFSPVSVTIANISELKKTDQTLAFDENDQSLSISSGNTVSLSSIKGDSDVNTLVTENSGNWNEAYNISTEFQSTSGQFALSAHGHVAADITDFSTAAAAAAPVQSVNGSTGTVTVAVPSASSATPAALGTAAAGSSNDFARADHVHAMPSAGEIIENIQNLEWDTDLELDLDEYNTFVIDAQDSVNFTYSDFPLGRIINVYLIANHEGERAHTFPEETYFSELGDNNVIYSVEGYATKISLQNIGDYIFTFSNLIRIAESSYGSYGEGIGLELLEEEDD